MQGYNRSVTDHILSSQALPKISIEVDPSFIYMGGPAFILYGKAFAEQHLFVVTGDDRRIERILWFQFEGFLQDNAHTYNYDASELLQIAGYPFLHDTYLLDRAESMRQRPDSDGAQAGSFLLDKGCRWDGDTLVKRMVWLDPAKRNELMIIYSEDLVLSGYQIGDLKEGGSAAAKWPALAQAFSERALSSFTILP
jgi:hypothetical protein